MSNPPQVALRRLRDGRRLFRGSTTKKEYVAIIKNRIMLMWVDEQDANGLLTVREGCCGHKRPVFSLATEDEIQRWMS